MHDNRDEAATQSQEDKLHIHTLQNIKLLKLTDLNTKMFTNSYYAGIWLELSF